MQVGINFKIAKCEVLSIRASCLVGYDVDITVNEGDNPYPYYDGPWIGARSGIEMRDFH